MGRKLHLGPGQVTFENVGDVEKKMEKQSSDTIDEKKTVSVWQESIQDPTSSHFLTEVTKDQEDEKDQVFDNTIEKPVQSMSQPSLHILSQQELVTAVQAKHVKLSNLGSHKLVHRHMSIA